MSTTLLFDKKGYLQPYEPIQVDVEILETYFVTAFPKTHPKKTKPISSKGFLQLNFNPQQ